MSLLYSGKIDAMDTPLTLLILAAGMGSRFGGLKQAAGMGPHGETILDYSVYDAIQAGFERVVLVIRRDMESLFREEIVAKFASRIDVEFAYQQLHDLPVGCEPIAERVKPWGTGHALWCARDLLPGPFAVINADDFYGRQAFVALADFLCSMHSKEGVMVAYRLANTLSNAGTVSRGVCQVSPQQRLLTIVEHSDIAAQEGEIVARNGEGESCVLAAETMVSMNCWGLHPSLLTDLGTQFEHFLQTSSDVLKGEFYLPAFIDGLIDKGIIDVTVVASEEMWMGVTYRDEISLIKSQLNDLIAANTYPLDLWLS